MGEANIFTEGEARFLRELVRRKVDFMVVGLSAAALQGAPMVTQDVDLWFRNIDDPGMRAALRKVGGIYVPPVGLYPPMFAGDNVECFDIVLHVHGIGDFRREIKKAISIELGGVAIKVLPLDRVIASKKALNRQKDRMVMPALKAAALALASKAGARQPPKCR